MGEDKWARVDDYLVGMFVPADRALDAALADTAAAGMPAISVAPTQGKFLELLATSCGARRILEIGTLGGYSTIWLARALRAGGSVLSLELEERHAHVARANLARAGFTELVEVRVGPAADSLSQLVVDGVEPFDFVFIDADKEGYPRYFELVMQLVTSGAVIVADNVVREGAVADEESADDRVQGVRRFLELVAGEPRVEATVLQTVGSKGYDGFAMLHVT